MVTGNKNSLLGEAAELRRRALDRLDSETPEEIASRTNNETQRLLHELQVHKIELEMQNKELRQARDEVEALLVKYTELYDFAPVGYLTLDQSGTICAANLSVAKLLGVDRSRLSGKHLVKFTYVKDRPAFNKFLDSVFSNRVKDICEFPFMTESDLPLVMQIEATVSASGEEVFATLRDVTERKQSEEKIRKLNEELERQITERTLELVRLNNELESFCYAISHEFRAPLARLEGFGTMLLEIAGDDVEQVLHCSRRIVTASARLRTVIDSLLNLNRLSRSVIHMQEMNLSEMARQIVSDLMENIGERKVKIKIAPEVTCTGDRYMIEICMRNLFGNAFKYSSKSPETSIELGQRIIAGEKFFS